MLLVNKPVLCSCMVSLSPNGCASNNIVMIVEINILDIYRWIKDM